MGGKHLVVLFVLCLASHVTVASIFEPVYLGCQCLRTTSKYIRPIKYAKVEIFPSSLACQRAEIIITLKTEMKVCVNPQARWVQNILNMLRRQIERSS